VLLTPSSALPGDPASVTGQACQTSAPACAAAVVAAAVEVWVLALSSSMMGGRLQRVALGLAVLEAEVALVAAACWAMGARGAQALVALHQ
ncbi:hypothetical protein V8C86DRAFT_2667502, partial [Haematococcus lacustris]